MRASTYSCFEFRIRAKSRYYFSVKIFDNNKDLNSYYNKLHKNIKIIGACCPYTKYNTRGNLTLEIGEILLAKPLEDYVVVHELLHAAIHLSKQKTDLTLLGYKGGDEQKLEDGMKVEEIVAENQHLLYIDFNNKVQLV